MVEGKVFSVSQGKVLRPKVVAWVENLINIIYCGRPAEPAILISTLVSNACAAVI